MSYSAILVNPFEKTLEVVEVASWISIAPLIGCRTFGVANLPPEFQGDSIYVDDEGLLKPGNVSFNCAGIPHPLFGKGLIIGGDLDGNSHAPKVPYMDYLTEHITWTPTFMTAPAEAV